MMVITKIEEIQPKKEKTMAFKDWTLQELWDNFDLKLLKKCTLLEDWLDMPYEISQEENAFLEKLRENLHVYAPHWNEEEWRMKFISRLLNFINFETKNYHIFYNRMLSAKVGEWHLKGYADTMIATGELQPKSPYFCFHEYKKEAGANNDPIGQLLSTMLAAQQLNNNQKPIYGAYVVGRMWSFVVLNGREYCISDAYVATKKEDLNQIYSILMNLKTIIDGLLSS